ncbi:MAG: hypothetical protein ACREHE_16890 [Rhizomicrobium sp.]
MSGAAAEGVEFLQHHAKSCHGPRKVFTPDSMSQMFKAKQAMSRYSIAQVILSDPVIAMVRRELRKLADGLNPDVDDIRTVVEEQVIKRELIEADEAKTAAKAVRKLNKQARSAKEVDAPQPPDAPPALIPAPVASKSPIAPK